MNEFQRMMLCDADKGFQEARYHLFKASIYLEKADPVTFKKTIGEIKKSITDLNNSSGEIIDFINEQDFPKSEKE